MAISHAGHNHPATPAGRRACRASGGDGDSQANRPVGAVRKLAEDAGLVTPAADRNARLDAMKARLDSMADEPIKLSGAQARKIARHAAKADRVRIQPKRSGARVAIDDSGCVQAALHIGRGKCACGWDTISGMVKA